VNTCRNIIDIFWKETIPSITSSGILDMGLIQTSENGHFNVAKFLVEKGAYLHVHDDYLLLLACEQRDLDLVKFF